MPRRSWRSRGDTKRRNSFPEKSTRRSAQERSTAYRELSQPSCAASSLMPCSGGEGPDGVSVRRKEPLETPARREGANNKISDSAAL
eukprot:scaffold2224_cov261-Pinguiococcus_pyrenoidosus.AAC.8